MILQPKDTQTSVVQNLLFQQMKALVSLNRSQVQKQSSLLPNLQYQTFVFTQYQMIAKQNEFLEQIKQEIAKKKSHSNHEILFCGSSPNTDILPIDNSFDMSNISSVQGFDDEPFKTKFGEEFQKSLLASALSEVQQNCSSQTYEAIKNSVLNSKQKQFETIQQKHQKLTKKHEELETSFIIKSTQLTQTETQLKQAQLKIEQIQDEKRKLKLKSNQLSEKEKRICKLETTLIFKQKLFHEGKKRYEREKNLFLSIEERLSKLYTKMELIWDQILVKMDESGKFGCLIPCENGSEAGACWKKEVMKKCRQQLIDQRNLLKEEQEQIEKEFEMMQLLSEQVQKLMNEKQPSSNTDPFIPSASSIIIDSK